MQMLAIYVDETSNELEIKFFFFANILLSLNPYRTQEKSCCKPIFFKIPIFQKRQLIIEKPINSRGAIILVRNRLAVRIPRCDGPERSSHMSVEKVQAVYITGVDPTKPAKERQCQIMIAKREVIPILI